jgi:hypothetical protein
MWLQEMTYSPSHIQRLASLVLARSKLTDFGSTPINVTVDLVSGGFALRRLLTILTAVMLFAHGMLGCCSHHVHACGQTHDPIARMGGNHCADAAHEHSTGNSERSGHGHQGNDDCRGSKCDLGRPAGEQVAQSNPEFSQPMALPLSEADQASAGGRLGCDLCTTGVLRPVRLHLVNQVMLI